MWEVFLYINPLCSYCLHVEQAIIDFTRKHDIETQYHFVTNYNMATINDYMQLKGFKITDIEERNNASQEVVEAAKLYKAASCQGNKKARNFLMNLQEQVNVLNNPFDDTTIKCAINNSGLDYKSIMADKDSQCVVQGLKRDQQLSMEMNIYKAPTAVVFDCENESKPGVMITDFGDSSSQEDISNSINAMLERELPRTEKYVNSSTVISLDKFRR
ncbi:DsbA family protein [Companilactobacillus musae]|uniref:DsbA family protein n=1 Tax=Companilactobacillus musae TaxID=1903258 RepID=UPI000E652BA6|nr:DsbA family protein [Companilactobacillus musae]